MEFRILGSFEVVVSGEALPLLPNKPRSLLALLLLHRGEAVSAERLVDELWGERPPATAAKSIQVYVSQLRRALGHDVLETRGRGYALAVGPDQVDAWRFERMLDEGSAQLEAGRHRQARELLAEAIGLWRGPALSDFAYDAWAQEEMGRLEDLRLAATELRIDADLALGRHATLIPELRGLVARNPTRERPLEQLMLALYRSGRQTEALSTFRERRAALDEELGLELSPHVRELEAAILRHDPSLGPPDRPPVAWLPERRRRAVAALCAVAGAVGVAAIALTGGSEAPVAPALEPLPASMCSPIAFEPGTDPQHLVVSDQALVGEDAIIGNQVAAAVEFVLRDAGFEAGERHLAYQSCDGSALGCAAAGRLYARRPEVIAIVGPTYSGCAAELVPEANRARPGPLAVLSPTNTMIGLTRASGQPEEPRRFYPTGERNYIRMVAADDFQSAALAMAAQQLGARRIFVLTAVGFEEQRRTFVSSAGKLALPIVGEARVHRRAAAIERMRAARPDLVVLMAAPIGDGEYVVRALRKALGPFLPLLAGDSFSQPALLARLGRDAEGLRFSVPGIDPDGLTGAGREMIDRLAGSVGDPHPYTVSAVQATHLLLDAIARSDGTRPSVVAELFSSEVTGGVIGDFSVTGTGDVTANPVTIYRVANGERRVDRVLTPPLNLVVPSDPF